MKKDLLFIGCIFILCCFSCKGADDSIKLREDNIPEVVAAMTLQEKARLVVGSGMMSMLAGNIGLGNVRVPGAAGTTCAIERLGIPAVILADGPAGLRIEPLRKKDKEHTFYATAFPTGTILASSWNEDAVTQVGEAMGNEVLEYGVDVILAPGLNLHRNPLNGRNFEYYSEDPVLSGRMAAAVINGIQSNGVGTCAKHFAANSQETCRSGNDARIEERPLRELYLKGFEITVRESAPWTIMSSYNRLNGEFTQSHRWLLTDVLRGEWGYKGLVMTDWTGKRDTGAQIVAGNDLMEPGLGSQRRQLIRQVKKGQVSMEALDACVTRVLELVVKTPTFKGYRYSNAPDLPSHAKVAKAAAEEGIVLLKNEGALPLEPSGIALYGVAGYKSLVGGTGSGNVHAAYRINLSEALAKEGYKLDENLEKFYGKYIASKSKRSGIKAKMLGEGIPEEISISDEVIAASTLSDAAVFVIGRQAGEGEDRHLKDDFLITDTEKSNLEAVSRAFHQAGKKVIAVLNIGGVIETASWRDLVDAIVVDWQPGQEGTSALAEVLSGRVNPSGKLPMTFPLDYFDIPSARNFPYDYTGKSTMNTFKKYTDHGIRNVDFTEYEEGLEVGYRYFAGSGKEVAWPFGFGLSYTSFGYSDLSVETAPDGSVKVALTVTNTGDRPGKEAVQVYVHDCAPAFPKPERELKAFSKTGLLQSGESQRLEMVIAPYVLASFNASSKAWECPSCYEIQAGASSEDIRLRFTVNN